MLFQNNINNDTPFSALHFSETSVQVNRNNLDFSQFRSLGTNLSDKSLIRLSGAPTNSILTVSRKVQWSLDEVEDEEVPPGILFHIENAQYISSANEVVLFRDGAPNRHGIYLKLIDFKPNCPKGLAARMLAVIVREALNLPGITRMKLYAAGGRTSSDSNPSTGLAWGGYVAWPTYGFDMPILAKTIGMAKFFPFRPPLLLTCRTVSELLKLDLGREYWKVVGDGSYMDFDLQSPYSLSLEKLDSFLGRMRI